MSSSIRAQLAELEALPMAVLQARWRSLLGSDPPRYNRSFLIRRLSHRLQELAHGGLSHATRARMEVLLTQAGCDERGCLSARPPTRGRREQPVAGTRLLREWNGELHEVTAVAGGFAYRGRRYRSLSVIAAAITSTHWNGPAFFGLRPSKQGKEGAR